MVCRYVIGFRFNVLWNVYCVVCWLMLSCMYSLVIDSGQVDGFWSCFCIVLISDQYFVVCVVCMLVLGVVVVIIFEIVYSMVCFSSVIWFCVVMLLMCGLCVVVVSVWCSRLCRWLVIWGVIGIIGKRGCVCNDVVIVCIVCVDSFLGLILIFMSMCWLGEQNLNCGWFENMCRLLCMFFLLYRCVWFFSLSGMVMVICFDGIVFCCRMILLRFLISSLMLFSDMIDDQL